MQSLVFKNVGMEQVTKVRFTWASLTLQVPLLFSFSSLFLQGDSDSSHFLKGISGCSSLQHES